MVGERDGVSVMGVEFWVLVPVGKVAISNVGGGIIKGVAVTIPGVIEGMGDWTGNG